MRPSSLCCSDISVEKLNLGAETDSPPQKSPLGPPSSPSNLVSNPPGPAQAPGSRQELRWSHSISLPELGSHFLSQIKTWAREPGHLGPTPALLPSICMTPAKPLHLLVHSTPPCKTIKFKTHVDDRSQVSGFLWAFYWQEGGLRRACQPDENVLKLDLGQRAVHFFWKGPYR